jgi:cytochrome c551/c552
MRHRFGVTLYVFAVLALVAAAAGCGGKSASGTTSVAATPTTTAATATTSTSGQPSPYSNAPPKPTASIAAMLPATPAGLAAGRRVFQAAARPAGCGFCHTLHAAATDSPLGPSLDAETREADLAKLSDSQLAQRVRNWMHDPICYGPTDPGRCMPKDLYTGNEANEVAVFVAVCGRKPHTAGCEPVAGGLTGLARTGERLFQTRGCVGCHFSVGPPATGPILNGLAGSKVKLSTGKTVTADDAYLTRSIAAPDSQIVSGYAPGVMSSRVTPQRLTSAQIVALVAYIKTLK